MAVDEDVVRINTDWRDDKPVRGKFLCVLGRRVWQRSTEVLSGSTLYVTSDCGPTLYMCQELVRDNLWGLR